MLKNFVYSNSFFCLVLLISLNSLTFGGCHRRLPEAQEESGIHISALQAPVTDLDPIRASDTNTQFIINNAWNGLVSWSLEEGIQPALAERWQYLQNGRKLVVKLRQRLHFSDGSPLLAMDVVRHFDRLVQTKGYFQHSYQGVRIFSRSRYEVEFHLKAPDPDFLNLLAGTPGKIVKRGVSSGGGWVGAGPFVPERTDYGWRLRRGVHDFEPQVGPKEIRFPVLSPELAIDAARRGAVDDLVLFEFPSGTDLGSFGFNKLVQPLWATWAIGLNLKSPKLQNRDLRCALLRNYRSENFVSQVEPSHLVAKGMVPFGAAGYLSLDWPPEEVRNQGKGNPIPIELFIPEELPNFPSVQQFLLRYNPASGLAAFVLRKAPFRWIIDRLSTLDMPAFLLSFNAELPAARFFLESLHSQASGNLFGLKDRVIDKVVEDTRSAEFSAAFLSQRYGDFHSRLRDICVAAPLMQVKHEAWVRSCVEGVRLSPVSEGYFLIRGVRSRCNRKH